MPWSGLIPGTPDLASSVMSHRGRTYGSPGWALLSFVLLAGLLAMHGLTVNHDGEMPAMVKAPRATSMAGPSLAPHPVATQAPVMPGHGAMELCLAVLGLALVLF